MTLAGSRRLGGPPLSPRSPAPCAPCCYGDRESTGDEANDGEDMTAGLCLACEVCAEEFHVVTAAYRARCGIVECPLCGSTDLVLLDPGDDTGPPPAAA